MPPRHQPPEGFSANPVPVGLLLASGALALAGIYGFRAARALVRRHAFREEGRSPPSVFAEFEHEAMEPPAEACRPYHYDPVTVNALVFKQIEEGERDPSLIATNTAARLFGQHPFGYAVVFPPAPDSRVEVKCVFDKILGAVDRAFGSANLSPQDHVREHEGVSWRTVNVHPGSPDLRTYPWSFGAITTDGCPAPGTFFVTRPGDTDADVFRDLVVNALAMAGVEPGPVMDSKIGRRLKKEARNQTLCTPFNDARVTSHSATRAGGRAPGTDAPGDPGITYMMGPNGRGLVWDEVHYDDLERLAHGLPAKRGVDERGDPIGGGRSPMVLYFAPVNLERLRGPVPVYTTEGMRWSENDETTLTPPPHIAALGVDPSGVKFEGGTGCVPPEGPREQPDE